MSYVMLKEHYNAATWHLMFCGRAWFYFTLYESPNWPVFFLSLSLPRVLAWEVDIMHHLHLW